jgi:PadR family transcriptional regulator PadR
MNSDATGKWEVQLRKGCVELATLASIWTGPLYGLQLLRRLESCSGLVISEGTIYPLLSRLERGGMIEAEWVETGVGRPRKYYTLTAAGRERTCEMSRLWTKFTGNFEALLRPVQSEPNQASAAVQAIAPAADAGETLPPASPADLQPRFLR